MWFDKVRERYPGIKTFGYHELAKTQHDTGTVLALYNSGTPLFEDGSIYTTNRMLGNCEGSFVISADTITTCMRFGGPEVKVVSLRRLDGFEQYQIDALILANRRIYSLDLEEVQVPLNLEVKFHYDRYPYPSFDAIRSSPDEDFTIKVIQYYFNDFVNGLDKS